MSLSDFLSGKKQTAKADKLAKDINEAGKSGLGYLKAGGAALNDVYSQDPTDVINTQIGIENKVARNAAADASRRASQLIAQRGMGSSSIGLGQEINNRRTLTDQLAMNNASGIARLRDMQIENGQGLVNTGNALFAPKANAAGAGIQMQSVKYRSGGLAGLAGQVMNAGVQLANGQNQQNKGG